MANARSNEFRATEVTYECAGKAYAMRRINKYSIVFIDDHAKKVMAQIVAVPPPTVAEKVRFAKSCVSAMGGDLDYAILLTDAVNALIGV